jgi:hypothetical protein
MGLVKDGSFTRSTLEGGRVVLKSLKERLRDERCRWQGGSAKRCRLRNMGGKFSEIEKHG